MTRAVGELPLWLPESGHLFQDVVDNGHKPCTGSRGRGMRYPHGTRLCPYVFTPFAQQVSEVLVQESNTYATCAPGPLRAVLGRSARGARAPPAGGVYLVDASDETLCGIFRRSRDLQTRGHAGRNRRWAIRPL